MVEAWVAVGVVVAKAVVAAPVPAVVVALAEPGRRKAAPGSGPGRRLILKTS